MGRLKQDRLAAEERSRHAALLGELRNRKIDVFCWCNRCRHNTVLDVNAVTDQLGPAFPVPDIGAHLRCTGCGSKDVAARPAWPSLGQVTRHHRTHAEDDAMADAMADATSPGDPAKS